MDFEIPEKLSQDVSRFDDFVAENVATEVAAWYKERAIPQSFSRAMGKGDWYGFTLQDGRLGRELGVDLRELTPSGPEGRVTAEE